MTRTIINSNPVFAYLFFLSSLSLLMMMQSATAQNTSTIPFNFGVVLDLNSSAGKMSLNSISIALSDFYAIHSFYRTRLVPHTRDSKNDSIGAALAVLELLQNMEVKAIIGPGTSVEANFVVELGEKAQVPILSFSASNPSLSSSRSPPFLVRTSLNDSSQVIAITTIIQGFGWKETTYIYEDSDSGNGLLPYLISAFQDFGAQVPYRSVISPLATDTEIREELQKLMKMQARVFIVHMNPSLGSRLFFNAKAVGMMSEGYSWIITDSMSNLLNSMDLSVLESMQGILGLTPYVPKTKELDTFTVNWKKKFRSEPSIYDLWAYDTVWALAMAAEEIGTSIISPFQKPNFDVDNSSVLATLGVSLIGPKLLQIIQKNRFKGLTGDFYLIDGQLQSSIFQILNVNGKGGKEIGFWTAKNGILRKLSGTNNSSMYSTSMSNLGVIIWPGDTTVVPKGWAILTNGRKLRVGVPIKNSFTQFVDQERNETFTGYSIDVFHDVMRQLPYAISYEFVPFIIPKTRKRARIYDDMIFQVFNKTFDALVGDITILANRSLYADFTLPYSEIGVSMVVRMKENVKKNSWVFLEPLSREMWLSTLAAFVFIGFVIWVFEHRINRNFRGSPSQQLGMIFWFSFSTLVFAHREKVRSNLSRLVLIVWVFAVLILTSSYTASLTTTLTVQQLTVSDISQLIKNGDNVGYQAGSYVKGVLESMGFDKFNLQALESLSEYEDALSKGTEKGGVAAIVDELPYLRLLLSVSCNKYVMVEPTYISNGFGFVFQKGSPLVLDFSRGILNLRDSSRLSEINSKWFGNQINCKNQGSTVSSNNLTIDSFSGLFYMTFATSIFSLLIFFASFLREHMHILTSSENNSSIKQRLVNLAMKFYQSEESCRTSKMAQLDQESQVMDPLVTSEYTMYINNYNNQASGTASSLDELRQFK